MVPPTPGQPEKQPMPIPLRLALLDRGTGTHKGEQMIVLDTAKAEIALPGFAEPPVLSEVDRMLGLADEVIRHKVIRLPEKKAAVRPARPTVPDNAPVSAHVNGDH